MNGSLNIEISRNHLFFITSSCAGARWRADGSYIGIPFIDVLDETTNVGGQIVLEMIEDTKGWKACTVIQTDVNLGG